jgi:hypothetical protein
VTKNSVRAIIAFALFASAFSADAYPWQPIRLDAAPIGYLDQVTWDPYSRALVISGWSIDPDTASPISVSVFANGAYQTTVTANGYRPDVAAAYPGYGANHGYYLVTRPEVEGDVTICTYGINVGFSGNYPQQLGCMTVPGRHKSVQVCESSSSIDANMALFNGDTITISASGTIWSGVWLTGQNDANGWVGTSAGDTFPLPKSPPFSLIYSFANTRLSWVYAGTYTQFGLVAANQVNTLYLGINDDVPGNGSGCFNVRVDAAY